MAHLSPEEEARRRRVQARADLDDAELLLGGGRFHSAASHAQQAGEKALKALLYARGEDLLFEHAVRKLGEYAIRYVPELGPLVDRAKALDIHYALVTKQLSETGLREHAADFF